jgi:hypothetical protein
MGKMINKNSEEIRKEWTPEKLAKLAKKKIPAFFYRHNRVLFIFIFNL